MPEMPEVETIKSNLQNSGLLGETVSSVQIFFEKSICGVSASSFAKKLQGQKFNALERKGKFLIFQFSNTCFLLHLRMSGKLKILEEPAPRLKHERVRFQFQNGRALCFDDQRKFGRIYLQDPTKTLATLGIEPLTPAFTLLALKKILLKGNQKIKTLLLDQKKVSGLGNIYVDESLWEAKVHPEKISSTLSDQEVENLFNAVKKVLGEAIQRKGTSLGKNSANYRTLDGNLGENQNFLQAYGRKGSFCFRCSTEILKIKCANRGTYYCPSCQLI